MSDNERKEPAETRANEQYGYSDECGPEHAEVDKWAAREHARRQEWLNGPSVAEKRAWARYERERRLAEKEDKHFAHRRREVQLANAGIWSLITLSPFELWSRLVETGREVDARRHKSWGDSRVPQYDDD